MKQPLVTIIIPTYNQSNFIIRAIQSALDQDYEKLEIIVSDDNSTDTTGNVVKNFLEENSISNVKFSKNTSNLGITRHYHHCLLNKATGDWIINVDGDDFLMDKSFISNAINLAAINPEIALVFGNYCEYHEDSSKYYCYRNESHFSVLDDVEFLDLYADNKILWNHNTIIYKKELAINADFFWNSNLNKGRNDWESFLRLVVNNKVGFIDTDVAAWTQHQSNDTKKSSLSKYLSNHTIIDSLHDYAILHNLNCDFITKWTSKMHYKLAHESCVGFIKNNEYSKLLLFLIRLKENRSILIPIKIVFSIDLYLRLILSFVPSFYEVVKQTVHSRKKAR